MQQNGDYAENKVIPLSNSAKWNNFVESNNHMLEHMMDKEHNALSEIGVEPSDAKLEYSINGGKYRRDAKD